MRIWKPGLQVAETEAVFQGMIGLLGSACGLKALEISILGNGRWRPWVVASVDSFPDPQAREARIALVCLAVLFGLPRTCLIRGSDGVFVVSCDAFGAESRAPLDEWEVLDRLCHLPADSLSLVGEWRTGEFASLGEPLRRVLDRLECAWEALLSLRVRLTGARRRWIPPVSLPVSRLLAYYASPRWRPHLRRMMQENIGPQRAHSCFRSLARGLAPAIYEPVGPYSVLGDPLPALGRAMGRYLETVRMLQDPGGPEARVASVVSRTLADGPLLTPRKVGARLEFKLEDLSFGFGLGLALPFHYGARALGRRSPFSPPQVRVLEGRFKDLASGQWNSTGLLEGSAGTLQCASAMKRMGILPDSLSSGLRDQARGYRPPEGAPAEDLFFGLAGDLLSVAQAETILGRALALDLARRISRILADEIQRGLSVGKAFPLGFAHGLAGAAFALSETRRLTGEEIPILESLKGVLAGEEARAVSGPGVCKSWFGIACVLNRIWPGEVEVPPAVHQGHGHCHGAEAAALALGQALPPCASQAFPEPIETPLGFLGDLGTLYSRLAGAPSLIWGGLQPSILPPQHESC